MKRRLLIPVAMVLGSALLFASLAKRENIPITLSASSLYPSMTIEDKIRNADLILIGTVQENLPSRWKAPDGQNERVPAPEELSDARGLLTDSIVGVESLLKGEISQRQVRVRTFVGEIGGIRWRNESQPVYLPGRTYLLFLSLDRGALASVDPGAYVSVNARMGVYEIVGDKAISVDDEYQLDELLALIEAVVASDNPPTSEPTIAASPAATATQVSPTPAP